MSEYLDAIIFIDRHLAKVFHVGATDDVKLLIEHTSAQRRHHQADHEDGTKHAVDDEFLHRIVASLDHAGHTLIAGPGNSKFELQTYLERHRPDIAARISGVETLQARRTAVSPRWRGNSFASAATGMRRGRNRTSGTMTSRSLRLTDPSQATARSRGLSQ